MDMFQDVGPKGVKNLLEEVRRGIAVLPDFQRTFVWEPQDVAGLLASIIRGYPAGAILRFHDTKFDFKSRFFEDVLPAEAEPKHTYLVLDGQQRLTSLFQSLYGRGEYRYFLDLARLVSGMSVDDGETLFYEKATSKRAKLLARGIDEQARQRVLPFEVVMEPDGGFSKWILQAKNTLPVEERDSFENEMLSVQNSFVGAVVNYQFPVVTLSNTVPLDALCTIFETINRTGVSLSLFELMTARFFKYGINLKTKWDNAVEKYPLFGEGSFEVDPYQVLQGIALSVTSPPTCQRKDILKLTVDELNNNWDLVCEGLNEGLQILKEECRIFSRRRLPTPSLLGPLAALMTIEKPKNVIEKGKRRQDVTRWLWCAIFSRRYEAAANTRAERDVAEMTAWFGGGDLPSVIASFRTSELSLREVSSTSSPVYKGVIALVLKNGSKDFAHLGSITEQMLAAKQVDDHHIFPKAFLEGLNEKSQRINCILNKTLIDPQTNKKISASRPSKYVVEFGFAENDELLRSHFIPFGPTSPLLSDDFDEFISQREDSIIAQIKVVTGDLS